MTARDAALLQLDAIALPGWKAKTLRRGTPPPLSDSRDRALAEQIFIGVVKNLLLLQRMIEHHSGRRLRDVDLLVQKILAIAFYQLRFLTRIPPAAAVDEAVKQARRFGRERAAGFVNAVLRNALRQPAMTLPDPQGDAAGYAEVALSHPRELFERMAALLGPEGGLELCRHDNAVPPVIVRLMHGTSADGLGAPGITVTPHEQAGMYVVEGAKVASFAAWAKGGIAQVQDPTAALAAAACAVRSGQRVLDRCAGRGTKTLQLREAVGEAGEIYAVDASAARCADLRELVASRRLENVNVLHGSRLAELGSALPATFDRVLVDVPCSNSGVLARRAEARYFQSARALASLAKLQREILEDSAERTAAGGLLIYSTCSIWPEENQGMVEVFLRKHAEFQLHAQNITLPRSGDQAGVYRDGGYYAVMARSGVVS